MLIPVPYGSIIKLHIPPTRKQAYSFPNRSKKRKKKRATQKSLPFIKWRPRGKEVRRMGQKQTGIRQKE